MSEGFAVQLTSGEDVAIRIFPDIHIVGGNIRSALPLATVRTQERDARRFSSTARRGKST